MIQYFLPETRDLVDGNYDFFNDSYATDRATPNSDIYAHQIFPRPNCDGMLASRSFLNAREIETAKQCGGIHKYLRFPEDLPIMGDCGAFQYIDKDNPPYTCEEICDYYQELKFTYGISLDHVITQYDTRYDGETSLFGGEEPSADMRFRYNLTLNNAEEIFKLVQKRRYSFIPVGSAQGWSPQSYADAVTRLAEFGYKYVAIGGVAKANDAVINGVLAKVGPLVHKYHLKLHILGVARPSLYDSYAKHGVTSCDSASPIFQAFKSSTNNYYTPTTKYTAVRIPPVMGNPSPIIQKILKEIIKDKGEKAAQKAQKRLFDLEQNALKAVRDYADNKIPLKDALKTLVKYDNQFETSKSHQYLYEQTLRDRPWEQCDCPICKKLGVEVIMLRGNNRNRRRGFHNTYVFYKEFRKLTGRD